MLIYRGLRMKARSNAPHLCPKWGMPGDIRHRDVPEIPVLRVKTPLEGAEWII